MEPFGIFEQMPMETVELGVMVMKITNDALLVSDGNKKAWIPKSQLVSGWGYEEGEMFDMEIPEWMAINEGLV